MGAPVVGVAQRVRHKRLPLLVLPLAVDDELVLVVPAERSRSANTPRPARQGFPVRADGRSSRRAGAPLFAAGRQAQVCGVQAVRRGRALRRGRAKAGGCGRDAPGWQVADDRKHFAASGAVRGHGYGCQPVSEGAAHVDLARVRRECECNPSAEPGVSHSARRRGTGTRRGRHTCRPPYGQTNRVGTSSLVCCGACCMAASRKAPAEPPTTHAECGCRGPGATGRAGQSTSASSVSTTWGGGWVCFWGGAPTAGISHRGAMIQWDGDGPRFNLSIGINALWCALPSCFLPFEVIEWLTA